MYVCIYLFICNLVDFLRSGKSLGQKNLNSNFFSFHLPPLVPSIVEIPWRPKVRPCEYSSLNSAIKQQIKSPTGKSKANLNQIVSQIPNPSSPSDPSFEQQLVVGC